MVLTVFENFPDLAPLVLATPVSLDVGKHSALVSPEVILGTEEVNGELSDLVAKVLDVCRDVSGMVDLCRPPSKISKCEISLGNKNKVLLP